MRKYLKSRNSGAQYYLQHIGVDSIMAKKYPGIFNTRQFIHCQILTTSLCNLHHCSTQNLPQYCAIVFMCVFTVNLLMPVTFRAGRICPLACCPPATWSQTGDLLTGILQNVTLSVFIMTWRCKHNSHSLKQSTNKQKKQHSQWYFVVKGHDVFNSHKLKLCFGKTKATLVCPKCSSLAPSNQRTDFYRRSSCFKQPRANLSLPLMRCCVSNGIILGRCPQCPLGWKLRATTLLEALRCHKANSATITFREFGQKQLASSMIFLLKVFDVLTVSRSA